MPIKYSYRYQLSYYIYTIKNPMIKYTVIGIHAF